MATIHTATEEITDETVELSLEEINRILGKNEIREKLLTRLGDPKVFWEQFSTDDLEWLCRYPVREHE